MRRAALVLLALTLARGAGAAGNNAGELLVKPPAARAMALGEAVVSHPASEAGVANFHENPAAAAFLSAPEISFLGEKGVSDDTLGNIFLGLPTELGNFG